MYYITNLALEDLRVCLIVPSLICMLLFMY